MRASLSALIVTLLALLWAPPGFARQAVTAATPATGVEGDFTVGDPDHRFESKSAAALWIAVHILPVVGSDAAKSHIHEYADKSPTLAGIRHIFVSQETIESFQTAWASLPPGEAPLVFRDADGQLRSRLAATGPLTGPALILLDPARRERWRRLGAEPGDFLRFSQFSSRFADLTRDQAARESNLQAGLSLGGFDPVAYVDNQTAIPGDKNLESAFRGVSYRFSSAVHRERFNANPERYLPAYGGWCATAMAKGEKVEVDPKNFKVTNGRLFLFYKGFFGNALTDWNKDEPNLTTKADTKWAALISKR